MDRQEFEAFMAQLDALNTKMATQAEALRATRAAAPPPRTPPPTLRPERAALWRIAMLCKAALGHPAARPEMHPYFVQIARVCREVVERREEDV